MTRIARCVLGLLALSTSGCLPLGVRGSPRPLAAGVSVSEVTFGLTQVDNLVLPNFILGYRRGLPRHRELGLEVWNLSGIAASYRAQLTGKASEDAPAVTVSSGLGHDFVGSRTMLRADLVRSWSKADGRLRYFGVQGLHQPPCFQTRWTTTRSGYAAGLFVGQRSKSRRGTRALELAVMYGENAVDPGTRGLVVQPSISFRGAPRH